MAFLDESDVTTWSNRLKEYFLQIGAVARVAQVISSGEVQATVSNVVHRLSEKLNASEYRKAMTWGEVKDYYTWGVLGTTQQTTGTTTTPNIGLTKPGNNATVNVADLNGNSDILDTQIQALKDVVTNAKSLLGQLGVDSEGDPVVTAAQARATLGAATDGGTTSITTLKDAETAISSLRDSVDRSSNGRYVWLQAYGSNGNMYRLQLNADFARMEIYASDDSGQTWKLYNRPSTVVTLTTSSLFDGNVTLMKLGRIVQVNIQNLTTKSSVPKDTTIFTVPETFRPERDVLLLDNHNLALLIDTSGKATYHMDVLATNTNIFLDSHYIAAREW